MEVKRICPCRRNLKPKSSNGFIMNLNTKLTCPACGVERPMNAFNVPEEIHEILRLAARFGKDWPWVEEYLYCFRSAPDKPLRATRVRIIMEEILEFVKGGGFSYDGKVHAVRSDAIHAAIKHVAQTNKTGFKNHNYMKKVAIDFNLKAVQKEESDQRSRAQEAARLRSESFGGQAPEKIRKMIEGITRLPDGQGR